MTVSRSRSGRLVAAWATAALAISAGCSASPAASAASPGQASAALEGLARAFRQPAGTPASLADIVEEGARAEVVFLGETHLDDVTHEVERALLEGIADRTGNRVVLSLEMFERDAQSPLDDYRTGRIPEREFLARSRPWGNYATDYRPLVELARARGFPVVAANAPAAVRRKVSAGGRAALDALPPDERAGLAVALHPPSEAYWRRLQRAVRGHGGDEPPEARLTHGQNLWDNTMAESCLRALEREPGRVVVHVVGAFHVERGEGTVAQIRLRRPATRVVTVSIRPTGDLAGVGPGDGREAAEFVVWASARARSESEGAFAVSGSAETRYRLRVPPGAQEARRVPLLVWLGDDGVRARDGLAWWEAALGDEAAFAVVEPPHLAPGEDLRLGALWASPETFGHDVARAHEAVRGIVDYATRRLPVDPRRVAVAGEGMGGAVVLWMALYEPGLRVPLVAVRPAAPPGLREAGLPESPPATSGLTVVLGEGDVSAVTTLVEEYRAEGLDVRLEVPPPGPVGRTRAAEEFVRAALGLPARGAPGADAPRTALVQPAESPAGLLWGSLLARRLEREGGLAWVTTPERLEADLASLGAGDGDVKTRLLSVGPGGEWTPADLRAPGLLPGPPGPFGGTTVLVVPAGAPEDARAEWRGLESPPDARPGPRGGQIRVAFGDGGPSAREVVEALAAEGRRNVLVVPAVFAAGPEEMRALRASLGDAAGGLALSYLPGLGGSLALTRPG